MVHFEEGEVLSLSFLGENKDKLLWNKLKEKYSPEDNKGRNEGNSPAVFFFWIL